MVYGIVYAYYSSTDPLHTPLYVGRASGGVSFEHVLKTRHTNHLHGKRTPWDKALKTLKDVSVFILFRASGTLGAVHREVAAKERELIRYYCPEWNRMGVTKIV